VLDADQLVLTNKPLDIYGFYANYKKGKKNINYILYNSPDKPCGGMQI